MDVVEFKVGEALKKLRESTTLTIAEFSAELESAKSTVSKLESNTLSLSMKTFFKYADYFEVTPVMMMSYLCLYDQGVPYSESYEVDVDPLLASILSVRYASHTA